LAFHLQFYISDDVQNLDVWARAVAPDDLDQEYKIGDGKPTIIKFSYGSGNVILFSYHPEILINSVIDDVTLSEYFLEEQLNWDFGNQTDYSVNLNSWNIVHAALQVASNQPVTKISELPISLSLKLFLEGSYNVLQKDMNVHIDNVIPLSSPYSIDERSIELLPDNIVDWILIEFCEEIETGPILSKSVLLRNDGFVVNDGGISENLTINIQPGEYHILVKHRNHLPIMSKFKVNISH
jgi:hypothetical protein